MGKIYAEILEAEAKKQFDEAMAHPSTIDGALMPDAHTGYSLPIGAVVAARDFIFPAWVGYDIGCGMCALKLDGIDKEEVIANAEEIFAGIYNKIPVGFHINEAGNDSRIGLSVATLTTKGRDIAVAKNWHRAVGSLGGGNHFIEIGSDEDDNVWVVIHSGSRGVGHGMATHYMKLAHPDGKCKDGNYGFSTSSQEGLDYIQDMNWALDFALANRSEMMNRIVNVITETLDISCYELDFSEMINKNHNHAVYDGDMDAWVHRKGATQADEGMMGVIPGNMLDGSFIVRGKGNPDSLKSSSHGAGRVLSRKKAKEVVDLKDFEEVMDGITAKVDPSTIDESPFAYKNIFEVMDLQKDLVDIIHHIKPLINIKG